jgi:hypothetical protein
LISEAAGNYISASKIPKVLNKCWAIVYLPVIPDSIYKTHAKANIINFPFDACDFSHSSDPYSLDLFGIFVDIVFYHVLFK